MMKSAEKVENHITNWLNTYLKKACIEGFVVVISGGIDSAVTSTLCARTGHKVLCLEMPIQQEANQDNLEKNHIKWLKENYSNIDSERLNLDTVFTSFLEILPPTDDSDAQFLSLANTRARFRMSSLYYFAALNRYLVVGTGNKVEDFGVGFYTKYGDGCVDISPIADLFKSEVKELSITLGVDSRIINAEPTDGLWDDGRTDENQLGMSYEELEEAMINIKSINRDKYETLRQNNTHKMNPIPVCKLPKEV